MIDNIEILKANDERQQQPSGRPLWMNALQLLEQIRPLPWPAGFRRAGLVTHRAPTAGTVIAKINAELDAALQAAEAEATAAEQGRKKIMAIVAALKSAWKQA